MNTQTKVFVSDPDGQNFAQVSSLTIGKLKDAQMIRVEIAFTNGALLIDNSFQIGDMAITRSAKAVRAGERLFFRHVDCVRDGVVQLTNIGLTVIQGKFQFVYHVDQFQFFMDGNTPRCPAVEKNNQLHLLLSSVAPLAGTLPEISQYAEPAWTPGQVIWYDPFKLHGIMMTKNGIVHFHLNNVLNQSGWRRLRPGKMINHYYLVDSERDTFQFEAQEIVIP